MIPKFHAPRLHDVPDEYLVDTLQIAKKVAIATGAEQYNILQNNGRLAHQVVDHVHCALLLTSPRNPQAQRARGSHCWLAFEACRQGAVGAGAYSSTNQTFEQMKRKL